MSTRKRGKLADLARRAGRWLGLGTEQPAPAHTGAIVADRFDTMTWTETSEQAPALAELADELAERFDYAADLVRDVFLAAYKSEPLVRATTDMAPSRLPNRKIVETLIGTPEFEELHRATVGDEYAAAMAVLAQASALRTMLERARTAQDAADAAEQAQRDVQATAAAVVEQLEQAAAEADADGTVTAGAAAGINAAIGAAETAEQAATQAVAAAEQAAEGLRVAVRQPARQGAEKAVEQVRGEQALMNAWGVEPGRMQRMPFAERIVLARKLAGARLSKFAALIGRFRLMAAGERARKVEHGRGELVGITLGDDVTRLIPSETATLGVPVLRAVFAARLAEGRLMQYESRGEEQTGRGAIIACVDSSSSMTGEREAWSKALALALLDQARAERRAFVGILFASATQLETYHFPAGHPTDIARVLEFGERFLNGGTNFEVPLSHAVDILEEQYNTDGTRQGDIAFITDGISRVGEDWMRAWNTAKTRLGFRVFGVAIQPPGGTPGAVLDAICDNVRGIGDLTDPNTAADMFRVI